ncbi:YeiH family protein [Halobaculum lipolyticum]|uniref:YeiH family protein n=1 Tax=Halobaculum lipolyticum TaxID=3032001 RepID=A0ABD5WKC4_9EURY|nr:putative sulfate exporter family transporter [Halobaculum sp. DT31]
MSGDGGPADSGPGARTRVRKYLPGVATLVAVAVLARLVAPSVPGTPLLLAVAAGAVVANVVGTPAALAPGVGLHPLLLETGIVLLGAGVSAAALVAAGPSLLLAVVAVVAGGLVLVEAVARVAGLGGRTGSLLAAGAAVCGVSAVAATASALDADESEVALAAGTVLAFDAVTLAAYPAIAAAFALDPRVYGVWAGLSMFSTGPVTAAGFAYDPVAGEWATVTKLARNALIGVVAAVYAVRAAVGAATLRRSVGRSLDRARDDPAAATGRAAATLWDGLPKFLVGFLAVAALANAGLLSGDARETLSVAADALFVLAFAGLGFDIRLDRMRSAGVRPVAVVAAAFLVVSGVAFVLASALF